MADTRVSIVLDDPFLDEALLQYYPETIFEHQRSIDDSEEPRQYWYSGLSLSVLRTFLETRGSGNYAIYREGITGKRNNLPLMVHKGLARQEMN